jgi:uncharacterized protein (DUF2336 family)
VAVSAALAEIAPPAALVALLDNAGAEIADMSFARMVERHGTDAALREALLQRPDLPLDVRHAIATALSNALTSFVADCGWLNAARSERATREAQEKTIMALSAQAESPEVLRLAAYLRRTGQLTPALILRALLSQNMAFVEAALADLTGFPPERVAALLHDRRVGAFSALYQRANLPKNLERAFAAAFATLREEGAEVGSTGTQLSRRMIERALAACARLPGEDAGVLTALLRRYEVEAAREEAREMAGALADDAALALVLEHRPAMLIGDHRDEWRDAA